MRSSPGAYRSVTMASQCTAQHGQAASHLLIGMSQHESIMDGIMDGRRNACSPFLYICVRMHVQRDKYIELCTATSMRACMHLYGSNCPPPLDLPSMPCSHRTHIPPHVLQMQQAAAPAGHLTHCSTLWGQEGIWEEGWKG